MYNKHSNKLHNLNFLSKSTTLRLLRKCNNYLHYIPFTLNLIFSHFQVPINSQNELAYSIFESFIAVNYFFAPFKISSKLYHSCQKTVRFAQIQYE
ncbi:hypothetical protein SS50377_20295 [Spironucleus salmonicida]|uniref:Uncharacterized protein n=1 Tax=Spironucleus salmonicida TaxID=348837 RepID=A0A9P8S170_9EUKA|nr:hypothetical protein SS50377_20295 [Spironucleus salmonicida]